MTNETGTNEAGTNETGTTRHETNEAGTNGTRGGSGGSAAVGYGQIDRGYAMQLATSDDDGPIYMVNLLRYHEVAKYGDTDDTDDTVSGREADDRYAPLDVLQDIGAEVVLWGDVEAQLLGGAPVWERVGVVRYPTRRSFIEMQARRDFQERHVHKEAGVERTIVMGCVPVELPERLGRHQVVPWADVAHPPTEDDGPIAVIHVIKYAEGELRDEMLEYQAAAAEVAVPHGVRIGGWFDVEGTIVGDGRAWDQVRFNLFPSKAAFMAVVFDPARMEAHHAHREPAMADTYTLIVRPTINRLDGATEDAGRVG